MNAFDKVYFKILTEQSQFITETDRTTKVIAKIGGGLLGMFLGNKIGEFAGEKLGSLIGEKFATNKATEKFGEETVKRAAGALPFDKGFKKIGQKLTTGAANTMIKARNFYWFFYWSICWKSCWRNRRNNCRISWRKLYRR